MKHAVVTAVLDGLVQLVGAANASRATTASFRRAGDMVEASLKKGLDRATLLEELARAHTDGRIGDEAYRKLIATIARILKRDAELLDEVERVIDRGRGR